MKKQYIKFEEGNEASLKKACELAEKNGCKQSCAGGSLNFNGQWLLAMSPVWIYHTTWFDEQFLISCWYTELVSTETIKWVYVSNESEERALKNNEMRILITTLPWKAFYPYITVKKWCEEEYLNWEVYYKDSWKYIVEIPEETPIVETLEIAWIKYSKAEIEKALKEIKPIN